MPLFKQINFRLIFLFSILLLISCEESGRPAKEETIPANPYNFVHYPEQKYTPMYFGEIIPNGWIKGQIETDLNGFIGHLDELAPEIIVEDDIYGEDRRTNLTEGTDEIADFKDLFFKPKNAFPVYEMTTNPELEFHQNKTGKSELWKSSYITGNFWNPLENKNEQLKLVPMGRTILRQLTFPHKQ